MTPPTIQDDSALPVHAYLDGELDPANALAVERQLSTDPALAAECARVEALQRAMRAHLPREMPPPGLRHRVETAVGMERRRAPFALARTQPSWRGLAASIVLTAFVAGATTSMFFASTQPDVVRTAVVDAHIRSLMAPQPIDVASSDRHTVKPWFNGRIPQAPRVVDLARADFPLVGGRIDVVGEVPVPTLVYAHGKHLVSVTAVPDSGRADAPPAHSEVNGYNMYRWIEDGVGYWAVSDIAAADLGKLVTLFRTSSPDQ
jgi:anti-sigma factor RsiW